MNLRYVPGRTTLFDCIERLLPGEYAVVDKNGLCRRFYWKIPSFGGARLTEAAAIDGAAIDIVVLAASAG